MLSSSELSCLRMSDNREILPVCENPKVIFNRAAIPFLQQGCNYYLGDEKSHFVRTYSHDVFYRRILPFIQSHFKDVTAENYEKYFVLDKDGTLTYLFQFVPCGHCLPCQHRKKFSFAQMCTFETLSHSFCPIFGTLTYDNEHLPLRRVYSDECYHDLTSNLYLDNVYSREQMCALFDQYPIDSFPPNSITLVPELRVRDVQLFLKRFRQSLKRKFNGKYDFPLRYAITGEYGEKNSRPHYHFIFWNLHAHNHNEYNEICSLINESWQNGYVQTRVIDVQKMDSDKCFQYTAKYVAKDGFQKSLRMSSKKNGGIGSHFLIEHFNDFFSKPLNNSPLFYYNKFTASIGEVCFTNRVASILAPSWCRLFPSSVRNALFELAYFDKNCPLIDIARKYMFIPDISDDFIDKRKFHYFSYDECLYVLHNWFQKHDVFTNDEFDFLLQSLWNQSVRNQAFLITRFSRVKSKNRSQLLYQYKLYEERSKSLRSQYAEVYG